MATQALTLPVNITWRRLAYAADMIDTNFGDAALPPKWRSSMALYYYIVPKEQTVEDYPNTRIVYLRLTCSITGWNLDEEIQAIEKLVDIGDLPDDLQKSVFEAFEAGALAEYSPCTSAIAQVAVYPHTSDDATPDNFPFILDFEPKKRELYETANESGEFLSSTDEALNIQKGMTTTESTEKSDIITGGGGGLTIGDYFSISGKASGEWGTRKSSGVEAVEMQTTDTSRQQREKTSFTTTFNQMYQLFNGYHLGTNRALFYMQARPHAITENTGQNEDFRQVEFNLINGERKLEGLQDMFLVVQVPDSLNGLCVQANLDTGHTINIWEFGHVGGKLERRQLLVTRRVIQNCGLFNETNGFVPSGVPASPTLPPVVVAEEELAVMANQISEEASFLTRQDRVKLANEMNLLQRQVERKVLNNFSASRYKHRSVEETQTFRKLVDSVLSGSKINVDHLVDMGYVTQSEIRNLQHAGAQTVGDLFSKEIENRLGDNFLLLHNVRNKMTEAVCGVLKTARQNQ